MNVRLTAANLLLLISIFACGGDDASGADSGSTEGDASQRDGQSMTVDGSAMPETGAGADAATPTCEADLMSDPRHCGRCEHSCGEQSCIDGLCEPRRIATANGLITQMTVNDTYLSYLVTGGEIDDEYTLVQVRLSDAEKHVVQVGGDAAQYTALISKGDETTFVVYSFKKDGDDVRGIYNVKFGSPTQRVRLHQFDGASFGLAHQGTDYFLEQGASNPCTYVPSNDPCNDIDRKRHFGRLLGYDGDAVATLAEEQITALALQEHNGALHWLNQGITQGGGPQARSEVMRYAPGAAEPTAVASDLPLVGWMSVLESGEIVLLHMTEVRLENDGITYTKVAPPRVALLDPATGESQVVRTHDEALNAGLVAGFDGGYAYTTLHRGEPGKPNHMRLHAYLKRTGEFTTRWSGESDSALIAQMVSHGNKLYALVGNTDCASGCADVWEYSF